MNLDHHYMHTIKCNAKFLMLSAQRLTLNVKGSY